MPNFGEANRSKNHIFQKLEVSIDSQPIFRNFSCHVRQILLNKINCIFFCLIIPFLVSLKDHNLHVLGHKIPDRPIMIEQQLEGFLFVFGQVIVENFWLYLVNVLQEEFRHVPHNARVVCDRVEDLADQGNLIIGEGIFHDTAGKLYKTL